MVTKIIDKFHDWYAVDCCLYPKEEDVMACLREEMGGISDPTIDPEFVDLIKHMRERRNRRASNIRLNLKMWEIENSCKLQDWGK